MKCARKNENDKASFLPNNIVPQGWKEIDISNFNDYIELANGYNDRKYIIVDSVMIENPDYEQEQQERENERISHLKCTKRVLALILQELGIQYSVLKQLIDSNPQAQLEWDLCVELERSNPLIDIIGQELGLTPVDIDNIFKYANGEINTIQKEGE